MTTLDKMLQGLANALGASLSTLTTTAKTVVGAINELKSGLTSTTNTVSSHTSTIGSGTLNTTSQTLIGAVNEVNAKGPSYAGGVATTTGSDTEYPTSHSASFTAGSDGIAVWILTTTGSMSNIYVKDSSASNRLLYQYSSNPTGYQTVFTAIFPIIKNHAYSMTWSTSTGQKNTWTIHQFKFSS